MKKQLTSKYYRIRVVSTQQEEVLSSIGEARRWNEKLDVTFARHLTCELTEIKESLIMGWYTPQDF